MRQAEVYGYRPEGTNPCAGIRRYRRQGRQRFLSTAEIRRIGEVLARHEANRSKATAVIQLLLLTGCRKGGIVALKWRFHREGKLFLPDGKTGPRTVRLSSAARAILGGLPRKSAWVFPSTRTDRSMTTVTVDQLWYRVRVEAELHEFRILDLRHSFASRALALGESPTMIGKLLGHTQVQTTARYAHLARDSMQNAASRITKSIGGNLMQIEAKSPTPSTHEDGHPHRA